MADYRKKPNNYFFTTYRVFYFLLTLPYAYTESDKACTTPLANEKDLIHTGLTLAKQDIQNIFDLLQYEGEIFQNTRNSDDERFIKGKRISKRLFLKLKLKLKNNHNRLSAHLAAGRAMKLSLATIRSYSPIQGQVENTPYSPHLYGFL